MIGAAALALHGVSRSTGDQDLLVTDSAVLAAGFWESLERSTTIDVRRGDDADPLARRRLALDTASAGLMLLGSSLGLRQATGPPYGRGAGRFGIQNAGSVARTSRDT